MRNQVVDTRITEDQWKKISEDMLIAVYCADMPAELSREDKLALALKRDEQAAKQLEQDAISEADLERAAQSARTNRILYEPGY